MSQDGYATGRIGEIVRGATLGRYAYQRKYNHEHSPITGEFGSTGDSGIVPAKFSDGTKTDAYKRAVSGKLDIGNINEPGKGDLFMHTLLHEQGFDAKPHVVSKKEMDGYIASGEQELMRGVGQSAQAEQFKTGDLFAGRGVFGAGTYTAYGSGAHSTALQYAAHNASEENGTGEGIRMSLKKGARIISYEDLTKMKYALNVELGNKMAKAPSFAKGEKYLKELFIYHDEGRLAAMKGYDAIDVGNPKEMIILNRSVVRVQKEPLQ